MSSLSIFFLLIVTTVLIIGLIQTIRVGQHLEKDRQTMDDDISEVVKTHPYTKNPIFWTYMIGLGVAFAYLLYYMF